MCYCGGGGGGELSSHSLDSQSDSESTPAIANHNNNGADSEDKWARRQDFGDKNGALQAEAREHTQAYVTEAEAKQSPFLAQKPTPQKEQEIILDFFAGSGTTLHAVMSLNAQDGGNRACILVQCDEKINENISKAAFDFCKNELKSNEPVISDITIERVKRASIKLKEAYPLERLALGFSVFSLVEKSKLEDDDDKLKLFYSNISKKDRARNLSLLDEKPKMLHTELTELIKDSLYKCENSIYVASLNDEVLDYLRNTKDEKVYINGFEIDNLEAYKNLESMLDTRLLIMY